MTTVRQRFVHQSPRKIRLVARSVVGLEAKTAMDRLSLMPQRAAGVVRAAVVAALATTAAETVKIVAVTIDNGPAIKRRRSRSRGRSTVFKHQMSHIIVRVESSDTPADTIKGPSHGA